MLYEWSKRADKVPLGALPYLVGSAFPLVGVAVPFWLYLRSVDTKVRNIASFQAAALRMDCVGIGYCAHTYIAFELPRQQFSHIIPVHEALIVAFNDRLRKLFVVHQSISSNCSRTRA